MNLLFPSMLVGLLGLAVPIFLHLIARSRFPIQIFPSALLLRHEKRDNVFGRRFVDPLQLLLRLLVLSLLVLAMSRLFMPGVSGKPAPRNLVVIVDSSASMRTSAGAEGTASVFDEAKLLAAKLLGEVTRPSRCAVLTVGDELQVVTSLGPEPQAAVDALAKIRPGDGSGPGLVCAIARACEMLQGRREAQSQIVVLTDLRSSAFQVRKQRDLQVIAEATETIGDALKIVIVDFGTGDTENLAVVDAYLHNGVARIGDDAHVVARVKNMGNEERVVRLALTVGGIQEPLSRERLLKPSEEAVIDLTSRTNRSIRSFATVMLQEQDAMPHDNVFSVPFVVASTRRVLIINGTAGGSEAVSAEAATLGGMGDAAPQAMLEDVIDGARILQYALNPARELGYAYGTGVETAVITPEALPAQALSRFDIIVLYDVSSLSAESRKDLDTFVRQGKAVVFICSAKANPVDFNSAFGAADAKLGALSPALIGIEKMLEPAGELRLSEAPDDGQLSQATFVPGPWLAPFRDRRKGLSVVQLTQVREMREIEPGANVLLQGTDGRPLAVEARRENGRVILLGFGLEISRGNIAMTKVFPPLIWRLVDYLTGRLEVKPPDSLVASQPSVLDVTESAFGPTDEVQLTPARQESRPDPTRASLSAAEREALEQESLPDEDVSGPGKVLRISDRGKVMVEGLPVGHYRLHKKLRGQESVGYFRPIAVNQDPRQSDMARVSAEELQRIVGSAAEVIPAEKVERLAATGFEAWRLLMLLLLAAYLIEAIAAYVTGVVRTKRLERQESAGKPA